MNAEACAVQKRPWWIRLFPMRPLPPVNYNEPPEPGYAPGEFATDIVIYLGWRDRLRVLVSGFLHVEVRTATDKPVNLAKSRSSVYVMPPGQGHLRRDSE